MNAPCTLSIFSQRRPLLVVKLGDAHDNIRHRLGDFDEWMVAGLRRGGAEVVVLDPRAGDRLPAPSDVAGIVLTGSHAMVSDQDPWSVALMPWLQQAVACETPTLGICFGHQLLAQALGGQVDYHPHGLEIGTIPVNRHSVGSDDPLLGSLPEQFDVQSVHWQSVRVLPPGAVLLAGTAFEPHHAFRIGPCAWGVQFHPEFSDEVLRSYLHDVAPILTEAGHDVDAIAAGIKPTPLAASLLPTFARVALERALQKASGLETTGIAPALT